MRFSLKILIFILLSVSLSAQEVPLKFEIDSIANNNLNSKRRVYSIHYHVENKTNHPVSFFLIPHSLIANAASSMTLFPVYRIFQNDVATELDGPFFEKYDRDEVLLELSDLKDPDFESKAKNFMKKINEDRRNTLEIYKKNGGKSNDELWIYENQKLLASKIILQPNEVKKLKIVTSWDKKRYYIQDNIEFYLNENDKYEIEFTFNLMKTLFKDKLSEAEFKALEIDKNLVQGVFITNKMAIDFK